MTRNNNIEPWLIPLSERKAELLAAKKSGKSIALMLYPSPDASTFRYRGYNLFCATKQNKKWQLVYFFLDEIEAVFELVEKSDLLILSRLNRWDYFIDDLAAAARKNHIPVVNDLDDCVCGLKYTKNLFNTVSPDLVDREYWINTCANFELVSYATDGFLTTNDYLGKILSDSHDKKPYFVIPNSLNNEQIEYSDFLLQKKHHQKPRTDFVLGYFSGSATHATDLNVIYPELLQLLSDFPDIKLRIVGFMDLPSSANKFIENQQIEFYPVVDFIELQRLIAEVDVNLAPLADNVFTNCKSELKFFESAIVETPTIASPTFTFAQAIQNEKTGFLCRPGEWYDCILKLYQDRNVAQKVAANARVYALDHYAPARISEITSDTFDAIIKEFKA